MLSAFPQLLSEGCLFTSLTDAHLFRLSGWLSVRLPACLSVLAEVPVGTVRPSG